MEGSHHWRSSGKAECLIVLASVLDIVTALIPQFLLWNVQMKRKTKLVLDAIFALGVVIAALSIGRAATTNDGIWKEDASWRVMPSMIFSMVEEKVGIIIACGPALRQFVAYRQRVGTYLPSNDRQTPEADFVKMRRRINFRDIFWYRKATTTSGRVLDAQRTFLRRYQTSDLPEIAISNQEKSPMDLWSSKVKSKFSKSSSNSKARPQQSAKDYGGWYGPGSQPSKSGVVHRHHSAPEDECLSDTNASSDAMISTVASDAPLRPQDDVDFAERLSKPPVAKIPM